MREIKGPEDCEPFHAMYSEIVDPAAVGGVKLRGGDCFKAEEVGQIISLAMNAQRNFSSCVGFKMTNQDRKQLMDNVTAWRELAERLKGNECRCTRCGHEVCVC